MVKNKIDGIKQIRTAASNCKLVLNENTGRMEVVPGIGLKEAKDLYEAIAAYAIEDYLRWQLSLIVSPKLD